MTRDDWREPLQPNEPLEETTAHKLLMAVIWSFGAIAAGVAIVAILWILTLFV
jgi:hypothetical protein